MLKNAVISVALAASFIPAVAPSVMADTTSKVMAHKTLDMKTAASSYRASKVIGMSVVNATNDTIGTIDDLLVTRKDRVLYAVVSVGGFLGVGDKLVAVKFEDLEMMNDKVLFTAGTKASLEKSPAFTYVR